MSGSNEKLRVLRRIPEIRFDEELRGYNKHQVDRVLENLAPLADEVDVLVDRLSEAERRAAAAEARVMEGGGPAPTPLPAPEPVVPETLAPVAPAPVAAENFDETLSKTLLLAQRTADATVLEANETATRITSEAEAEAIASREAVEQEAVSMRAAVADERAASVEQANREVAAMIDAARATIDTKVAEAEAELEASHATTRDDLIEQIGSLQRARDGLALDVEHFEGHLSSRREVLRGALAELTEIVEDPERLRSVMPPTPMADLPEIGETEAAQIGVVSLDTLATEVTADAEAQGVMSPDLANTAAADGETTDDTAVAADAGEDAPAVEISDHVDEGTTWADEGNTWADETAEGEANNFPDRRRGEQDVDDAVSSGVLIDPIPSGDDVAAPESAVDGPQTLDLGEPTQALPIVEDAVAVPDPPAMDATPEEAASSDPFLDELRRATSEDDDDEALSKFLTDADESDDGKGGWFGRRK